MDSMTRSSAKKLEMLMIDVQHSDPYQRLSSNLYLSRRHCLSRWTFCDILQISEGPQRWQRYFQARRKVEARIDQGRPGRDYRVS